MKEFRSLCRKVKNFMIDTIYPVTCVFCGEIHQEGICKTCQGEIVYISEPRCKKCGKPIRYQEQEYCKDCANAKFIYNQGRSLWIHKHPVNKSIYQFKYQNRRIYAKVYARELNKYYGGLMKTWGIQALVPVPLHKKKQRKRGYNQAEVLAEYLSAETKIPIIRNAVGRKRNTKPQKTLNNKERRKNLKDAFFVTSSLKAVERVLLIDDIYTTGSTIDIIASLLKKRGVLEVYFLTISIGQGF